MWNKQSPLLLVSARHGGRTPWYWLWVSLSLFAPHQLMLAVDAILSLIPGDPGRRVRALTNSLHAVLLEIMSQPAQEFVNVSCTVGKRHFYARVKTAGFGIGFFSDTPCAHATRLPPITSLLARLIACLLGLLLGAWLLSIRLAFVDALLGALLLTLFYTLLRPLSLVIALPFNLFLFSLATPFVDALFLLWMAAWVPAVSLSYMQCVLCAVCISCLYYPYSLQKQRALCGLLPK